jgi:hypothetical protein
VLTGNARLEMHRLIVVAVVVMLCWPIVLVGREPVVVLRVIVVTVQVNVPQRHLARGRGQDQAEQDRYCARHTTSVCKLARTVKPVWLLGVLRDRSPSPRFRGPGQATVFVKEGSRHATSTLSLRVADLGGEMFTVKSVGRIGPTVTVRTLFGLADNTFV